MGEMRTAHDRMEQWLRTTHYSHRTLQDLDHHTASLFERALVDAQNVEGYLANLCQSVLHTETAPATFVAELHRCVQNAQQATVFHEISIPQEFGGQRVLETSLLVSSKKSNGEHFEFLFAQYADFSRLAPALRRMAAAHHEEESIKLWLNYKLCLQILDDKPGLLTIAGKQGVVAGAPPLATPDELRAGPLGACSGLATPVGTGHADPIRQARLTDHQGQAGHGHGCTSLCTSCKPVCSTPNHKPGLLTIAGKHLLHLLVSALQALRHSRRHSTCGT